MISKILPVSFKGTTDVKTSENAETKQNSTTLVTNTEPQVDTFTNTTKKPENGNLLTGILGILDMVNTLLSITTKK